MPIIDIILLVFGVLEIVLSGYWGRIGAAEQMRSSRNIKRSAIWIGVGAVILALVDYGLLRAGCGSPLSWLLAGKR